MPFVDSAALPIKEPLPGWKGRFFDSEQMTFCYYEVEPGAAIHEHAHPNEEVWHVIAGEIEVTIAGVARVATAGSAAIVPPNVPHAVRVLTPARVIVAGGGHFPQRDAPDDFVRAVDDFLH